MGRNNQGQAWLDLKDILRLRHKKLLKSNGKIETDAETFKRIMDKVEQDEKQIKQELRVKLDDKKLFR